MKTKAIAVLVLFLVAACSDKQLTSQQTAAPASGSPNASALHASCEDMAFYSPLPEGVAVSFPFHLRSDRISPREKGGMKRRVVLEIVEGDVASDFESAKQSLLTAGYKPSGKHKGDAGKKQSQKFKKKGSPTLYLTSNTSVGKKPANPDAKGVVYFDWLVSDVSKAAPVTPSE